MLLTERFLPWNAPMTQLLHCWGFLQYFQKHFDQFRLVSKTRRFPTNSKDLRVIVTHKSTVKVIKISFSCWKSSPFRTQTICHLASLLHLVTSAHYMENSKSVYHLHTESITCWTSSSAGVASDVPPHFIFRKLFTYKYTRYSFPLPPLATVIYLLGSCLAKRKKILKTALLRCNSCAFSHFRVIMSYYSIWGSQKEIGLLNGEIKQPLINIDGREGRRRAVP